MKRLLLQFSLVLALPVVFAGVVSAANHYWKIDMSDPTAANQERTFNVEYTALSTASNDQITVRLVQDGTVADTQTTAQGGDSGMFRVSVAEDGTYVYSMSATSSQDGSTKSTQPLSVTVTTPVEEEPPVIEVSPDLTPEQEADLIAAAAEGDAAVDPEVAGATDEDEAADGEVTDEALVTDEEDGEILGVEDEADEGAGAGMMFAIAGIAALLALAYWYFFYRKSGSSFRNNE